MGTIKRNLTFTSSFLNLTGTLHASCRDLMNLHFSACFLDKLDDFNT